MAKTSKSLWTDLEKLVKIAIFGPFLTKRAKARFFSQIPKMSLPSHSEATTWCKKAEKPYDRILRSSCYGHTNEHTEAKQYVPNARGGGPKTQNEYTHFPAKIELNFFMQNDWIRNRLVKLNERNETDQQALIYRAIYRKQRLLCHLRPTYEPFYGKPASLAETVVQWGLMPSPGSSWRGVPPPRSSVTNLCVLRKLFFVPTPQ